MTNWTQEREAAARARCDAAVEDGRSSGLSTFYAETYEAQFCAHTRTDLPDALDEIERLRKELCESWEHEDDCPCQVGIPLPVAPPEYCNCGLKEVLYGH